MTGIVLNTYDDILEDLEGHYGQIDTSEIESRSEFQTKLFDQIRKKAKSDPSVFMGAELLDRIWNTVKQGKAEVAEFITKKPQERRNKRLAKKLSKPAKSAFKDLVKNKIAAKAKQGVIVYKYDSGAELFYAISKKGKTPFAYSILTGRRVGRAVYGTNKRALKQLGKHRVRKKQ